MWSHVSGNANVLLLLRPQVLGPLQTLHLWKLQRDERSPDTETLVCGFPNHFRGISEKFIFFIACSDSHDIISKWFHFFSLYSMIINQLRSMSWKSLHEQVNVPLQVKFIIWSYLSLLQLVSHYCSCDNVAISDFFEVLIFLEDSKYQNVRIREVYIISANFSEPINSLLLISLLSISFCEA